MKVIINILSIFILSIFYNYTGYFEFSVEMETILKWIIIFLSTWTIFLILKQNFGFIGNFVKKIFNK
jgi:hypothetical protein